MKIPLDYSYFDAEAVVFLRFLARDRALHGIRFKLRTVTETEYSPKEIYCAYHIDKTKKARKIAIVIEDKKDFYFVTENMSEADEQIFEAWAKQRLKIKKV